MSNDRRTRHTAARAMANFRCITACVIVVLAPIRLRAQSIFTVAGGGLDDGRPATLTPLVDPQGIAVDGTGNLYITQGFDHRIRVVLADTGLVDTIAGTGIERFSGDGGPATRAELDDPRGIAADADGNLFIADRDNHRVRRVSAQTGVITTVAGTGSIGFSGEGGLATQAQLSSPFTVALDDEANLYIADTGNHRIRRVDAVSGVITTVAGTGNKGSSGDGGPATAAEVNDPTSLAVDYLGNLFFAEPDSNRIRRVTLETGNVTTVAGTGESGDEGDGGPATEAKLDAPRSVVVNESGNVLIADTANHRIRRVDPSTGTITAIAGTGDSEFSGDGGAAVAAGIGRVTSLALDSTGNLYIESGNHSRVRKVDVSTGVITTVAGNGQGLFAGDGRPATDAGLARPTGVAVDSFGNIYIASWRLGVRRVDGETGIITTVAGNGDAAFSGDGGAATQAGMSSPDGLAIDSDGNLFVSDTGHLRVRRVDAATGIITTVAGNGSPLDDPFGLCFFGEDCPAVEAGVVPAGIAADRAGNLYVADTFNGTVRVVDAITGLIHTFAGTTLGFGDPSDNIPATEAALVDPAGVTLDADANLYIADRTDCRVRRVDALTGIITTVAGRSLEFGDSGDGGPATAALLQFPRDVAVSDSGDIFISDAYNYKVRRIDGTTGIISTLAGTGNPRFSGDGGPASRSGLALTGGVTTDSGGNLYVSDESNNRVRMIPRCVALEAPGVLTPANGSQGVSTTPSLGWTRVAGAQRYDVFLDRETPPSQLLATDIQTTLFAPANLEPLTTYYWKIVAKGDPFCEPPRTAESPVRSFTTASVCDVPGGTQTSED